MNAILNFIKKLRESDEGVKRKWLIILSGGGMLIVVFLWISYFQLTLPRVDAPARNATHSVAGGPATAPTHQAQKEAPIENRDTAQLSGIMKNLYSGFHVIKDKVASFQLFSANTITLLPSATDRNFALEGLEEIPPHKFRVDITSELP